MTDLAERLDATAAADLANNPEECLADIRWATLVIRQLRKDARGLFEKIKRLDKENERLRKQHFEDELYISQLQERVEVLTKRKGDMLGAEDMVRRLSEKVRFYESAKYRGEVDRLNMILRRAGVNYIALEIPEKETQ